MLDKTMEYCNKLDTTSDGFIMSRSNEELVLGPAISRSTHNMNIEMVVPNGDSSQRLSYKNFNN